MAKRNYLIEGLSGTGKTSVAIELKNRGLNAIDADEELGYFADPKTMQPTKEEAQLNWHWDTEKAKHLFNDQQPDELFVCGGSMNQQNFYKYFSKIFTLFLDNEALRDRLMTRTNNAFGKHPDDLTRQLEWNSGTVEYSRQRGTILIDASKPIKDVVDAVIAQTLNTA